jgi:catechol-2,3-dioxygenase
MRIKELTLYTSQISLQKKFYTDILGLKTETESESEVSFNAGRSILKFVKKETSEPYHFAFNIPSNKIYEALSWLKQRVEIQKDGNDEIVDFPSWNARSIYFYDADKNILEFIARKNLNNGSSNSFGPKSILEISEIGLATAHFNKKYDFLISEVGINKFSGGNEVFCAIGSETGLVILIDKNRKDWFPTNDKAYASGFRAKIEDLDKTKTFEFQNEKLKL